MKYEIPFDKLYSEMTRGEKRAYKRWLAANKMWDGEVVLENMKKKMEKFLKTNASP